MSNKPQVDRQYCSIHSRLSLEPLIGSAPRTDYWILLEYPYPMSAKALQENRLPDEVKRHLAELQTALPTSRVLLIRRNHPSASYDPVLFLADGRDGYKHLYKYPLTSYADLLKLDFSALFNRSGISPEFSFSDCIFLVCTNGKRDICCSKWGQPLFISLEKQYGEMVWQTSHVGGHRFAPNLICLPHGLYYGRVPLDHATGIADRYLNGRLTLSHYRGSAAYPPPAQAAENFLRLETNEDRIGIYHLDKFSPVSENHWEISFIHTRDHSIYQMEIESYQTDLEIFEGCSAPLEKKAINEFRLLGSILVD